MVNSVGMKSPPVLERIRVHQPRVQRGVPFDTPSATSELKRCSRCRNSRPRTQFSKDASRRDGLDHKCKLCRKNHRGDNREHYSSYRSSYYRQHREHVASYYRAYVRRPEHSERQGAYSKRALQCHPDRHAARSTARAAIRKGVLTPQPCEACGEPKVEAHHDDYSRPLDVRWLCFEHHLAVHGKRPVKLERASRGWPYPAAGAALSE